MVFFAETVTLAHVARPVTLASGLDPSKFDVTLAWHPRYETLFPVLPFATRKIRSIEPAQFLATLDAGRPSYDVETLVRYVEEDLQILDELRPDVVVGDFRLSLSVSARLRKIPYVNITNAYWSPYADVEIPVPDVAPLSGLPTWIAKTLFRVVRPFVFARNAEPMRAAHRFFGVPPPPRDVRAAYTLADFVAYVDLPALVPMPRIPSNHHCIGPLLWSPSGRYPDWWDDMLAMRAPKVYVTLGSSGAQSILPKVLAALADVSCIALVATAGRDVGLAPSDRVLIADYLPGAEAAAASDLVICNGGSPTSYQALSMECPVFGICTNLDQQLNMRVLEAFGAGIGEVASRASAAKIRDAFNTLNTGESYRVRARELARLIRDAEPPHTGFGRLLARI
ncbi:MAG: nucleotide disphospho-sugar-binding domain-containing protein [Gammaproteobacteria bacterium]